MPRKLNTGPCGTFINKQWYKKATGNQTMLGPKPPTRCCHSNHGGMKRTLSLSISHVPKIGTTTCFPYPAMQVSKSWHTQDGFFLHERKGTVRWYFHHCWKAMLLNTLFWGTIYPERLNQHVTSAFVKSKNRTRIVLDFRTNNNIKKYICYDQFFLQMSIDSKNLLKPVNQGVWIPGTQHKYTHS